MNWTKVESRDGCPFPSFTNATGEEVHKLTLPLLSFILNKSA